MYAVDVKEGVGDFPYTDETYGEDYGAKHEPKCEMVLA